MLISDCCSNKLFSIILQFTAHCALVRRFIVGSEPRRRKETDLTERRKFGGRHGDIKLTRKKFKKAQWL